MRGDKTKTPVIGMVERKGRVIARAIPDTTAETLVGTVHQFVLPASTVFTDELQAYNTIPGKRQYKHQRINHSSKVYVMGNIHTNTIEGFWSLVKRGIGGVYHSVSQKYLQTYLDEYSYRYNLRDQGNLIFTSLLKRVSERADSLPAARDRGMPVVQ